MRLLRRAAAGTAAIGSRSAFMILARSMHAGNQRVIGTVVGAADRRMLAARRSGGSVAGAEIRRRRCLLSNTSVGALPPDGGDDMPQTQYARWVVQSGSRRLARSLARSIGSVRPGMMATEGVSPPQALIPLAYSLS